MTDASAFWFLASPYDSYGAGHQAAWIVACRAFGELRRVRVPVFSPVVVGHAAVLYGNLQGKSRQFWWDTNEPMLRSAHGLIVLMAEGWGGSEGMMLEIAFVEELKRPIVYMHPATVPRELLTMLPAL